MKSVRLLPIVICAAAALLVFKTVGIVTNGGYVLSGVAVAGASGGGAAAPAEGAAPAADGAISIPSEPTVGDTSPTLTDSAPTLGTALPGAEGHGAPAQGGQGAAAPAAGGEHGATPEEPNAAEAAVVATTPDCPVEIASPAPEGEAAAAPEAPAAEGAASSDVVHCLDMKDAAAMSAGADGNLVPLSEAEGALATQKALLARLSERRTELDKVEADLDMRSALVSAAEKRLEERAAAVKIMEDQISAMVAEKKALEEGQLKSIVAMYEAMKPKDAAIVFNTLEMDVLLRVAKVMNVRKMAPIMAKMLPERAQELTVRLAAIQAEPQVAQAMPTGQDLTALPQIVGQ